MLKVLTKEDINLIVTFYRKLNMFSEDVISKIYNEINESQIICANIVDNKISSLLISAIIKHDYYIEKIVLLKEDFDEIKDLISFTVRELRKDERGLNIIYDNFPYNELMHQIMLENGFRCNYLNLIDVRNYDKIDLIKPNIALNDKSEDVKDFIYNNLVEEIKSNIALTGVSINIPDKASIHLENTNVAVIRDESKCVVGTVRFGIVSDSLYLYNLYGNTESIIRDLLCLVKNLTTKNIEVGIYPTSTRIIEILENNGFKKYQTDYILKLR